MKAAGGVLTGKQAPHRPGTAPTLGLRAGGPSSSYRRPHARRRRTMSFRSILAALRSARLLPQARPAPRRAVVRPRRTVLAVEALEDRAVPSTFTVTNLLDDGSAGSLRSAINQANAAPGPDTIAFARGLHGTVALDPTRGELDITGSLTI